MTLTLPARTGCAAGRTGAPRCWRRGPTTSATPTSRSAAGSSARSSTSSSSNDLIRPRCDVDAVSEAYDDAIATLTASGATVGVFTAFDPGGGGPFARLRGRFAVYNERVREIAERHGAVVLDSWRMRPEHPELMWSEDRLHLGPLGHRAVAIEVLDTLGVPHGLDLSDPTGSLGETPFKAGRRADLEWAVRHAAPWIKRRLTGRSSGDGITAKRPVLEPI